MPNPLLTEAVEKLVLHVDLSAEESAAVLEEIMAGEASEVQTSAFLVALRAKGETVEEIVGLARTMRRLAEPVEVAGGDLLDTAGTGGGRPTFNVSTTAAFVAAGAGCRVAKHGNRSATSRSGSADVLEALGARIDLDPHAIADCIEQTGFGFMFAPAHHRAMRHVVPVRRELAVRTVFNFLGPLTNPAGAERQLIGVSDPDYLERLAGALGRLGGRLGLVVSSEDGLDEVSVCGRTRMVEVSPAGLKAFSIGPSELGLEPVDPDRVRYGSPERNAAVLREVLAGEAGPERSLAVANAGAAVYVAGRAASLAEGVRRAEEAIDSGAASAAMEGYLERTRALAAA
ncbi:MAG: anthranilate phosphoribosyltransferase [Thermoleophilaceae bacterium]